MNSQSNEVLQWSLSDLACAIEKRSISPVEVAKLIIKEISERNKKLNAYITVMEEDAIKASLEAEKAIQRGDYKGPLHGVPIAIKDNVYVKGINNTVGSQIYKDFVPNTDSEIVHKLKAEGAIIIGKTNMSELALGGTGDISYFGPARNPHNTNKITGGSSSGSGAVVGGDIAYGAIGSDTGGSIRVPSACCGIVGMKPTFGLVSKSGTFPLCPTLDHFGPMTKTVKDNAIMLNALVGYDSKDPYSIQRKKDDYLEAINASPKTFTIGVPSDFFYDLLQAEIRTFIEETIQSLMTNGFKIKSVELDFMENLLAAHQTILSSEAYATFKNDLKNNQDQILEETRSRLYIGRNISQKNYHQALKTRKVAIEKMKDIFKQIDIILTPTIPIMPTNIYSRDFKIDGKDVPRRILGRLTGPMNTTGFPAISIPGLPANGLPTGIQLIGQPFAEKKLYRLAAYLEAMHK